MDSKVADTLLQSLSFLKQRSGDMGSAADRAEDPARIVAASFTTRPVSGHTTPSIHIPPREAGQKIYLIARTPGNTNMYDVCRSEGEWKELQFP
jgi:hypothetical protein